MTTQISVSRRSIRVLRVMLSGIFLIASANHLMNVEQTAKRIDAASMKGFAYLFGDPEILVILSGVVMLVAGLAFFCRLPNPVGGSDPPVSSHPNYPYHSGRTGAYHGTLI